MKSNSRNHSYDLIRMVAFLMVVLYHSPMATMDSAGHGFFLGTLTFLVRPCIGLFLMISGALLLPTKHSAFNFLSHRLSKVIFPTLLWSLVYIILYNHRNNGLSSLLGLPFDWQGHPILWYMYTLIGLYLLAPIISGWLISCTQKELEFYLLLWIITLCYPYFDLFTTINTSVTGVLYYFTGYIGYFILGFYLKEYGRSFRLWPWLAMSTICLFCPALYRVGLWPIDQDLAFGYLSPIMTVITITWFIVLEKFIKVVELHIDSNDRRWARLQFLANLTFGGYLIHVFVLEELVWKYIAPHISSYVVNTLIGGIITFLISLTICGIISFLPLSKYVIGYQHSVENSNKSKDSNSLIMGGGN